MHGADDPLLALTLRFVVDSGAPPDANEKFLQVQLNTLKRYLENLPEQEQGEQAMEWIEKSDWLRLIFFCTLCVLFFFAVQMLFLGSKSL